MPNSSHPLPPPPGSPPPAKPPSSPKFKCPICRSQVYQELPPARDKRPVFECAGCSVLFRDAERFTRFDPHTANVAAPDFRTNWKS